MYCELRVMTMCQCRFILGKKCTIWRMMWMMGEFMQVWRQEVCGKSLCFPLNFVLNLKLLLKNESLKRKKELEYLPLEFSQCSLLNKLSFGEVQKISFQRKWLENWAFSVSRTRKPRKGTRQVLVIDRPHKLHLLRAGINCHWGNYLFILEVMGPIQAPLSRRVRWQNVGNVNWGGESSRVRECGFTCQFHYLLAMWPWRGHIFSM